MAVDLRSGVVVAEHFRLEREIGRGGWGMVWAATDLHEDKPVALKVLRPEFTDDGRRYARFRAEAKRASAVDHPNVVHVIDVVEWGGTLVMVMELLDGETLKSALEREEMLSLKRAATLLAPIAAAIAVAHERGIVHRDIKPANIFLARSTGEHLVPKVLDFGIAKLVDDPGWGTPLTRTGHRLGTPGYMAPEQLAGVSNLDGKADVWALGAILYECLTGGLPTAPDEMAQALCDRREIAVTPIGEIVPDLPAADAAFLMRMLSSQRDPRPTMAEAAAMLEGCAADAEHVRSAAPRARPQPAWRRRLALLLIVAGAAVALWALRAPLRAAFSPSNPAVHTISSVASAPSSIELPSPPAPAGDPPAAPPPSQQPKAAPRAEREGHPVVKRGRAHAPAAPRPFEFDTTNPH